MTSRSVAGSGEGRHKGSPSEALHPENFGRVEGHSNPLGDQVPDPIPGGCGSKTCMTRAWFRFELPDDDGLSRPCRVCDDAVIDLLLDRQAALLGGAS